MSASGNPISHCWRECEVCLPMYYRHIPNATILLHTHILYSPAYTAHSKCSSVINILLNKYRLYNEDEGLSNIHYRGRSPRTCRFDDIRRTWLEREPYSMPRCTYCPTKAFLKVVALSNVSFYPGPPWNSLKSGSYLKYVGFGIIGISENSCIFFSLFASVAWTGRRKLA